MTSGIEDLGVSSRAPAMVYGSPTESSSDLYELLTGEIESPM